MSNICNLVLKFLHVHLLLLPFHHLVAHLILEFGNTLKMMYTIPNGSIDVKAKCKKCGQVLGAKSTSGTSYLSKHACKQLIVQNVDIVAKCI